jgi:hypothetical protein
MGMLDAPFLGFDSELVDLLISMYEGMGNQIALQYAGLLFKLFSVLNECSV